MFLEDDLISISALQHIAYCERRFYLIFVEHIWNDNIFTAEGTVLHEIAHQESSESRNELYIARSLYLRSFRYGICGKCGILFLRTDNRTFTTWQDFGWLWEKCKEQEWWYKFIYWLQENTESGLCYFTEIHRHYLFYQDINEKRFPELILGFLKEMGRGNGYNKSKRDMR